MSRGVGFATAELVCDGNEAYKELIDLTKQKALEGDDMKVNNTQTYPTIEGIVTLAVKDKSSGGFTSEFDIVFTITEQ